MQGKTGWVWLLAACALSAQGAAIYKCEEADGHIVYRDHPCEGTQASREIDDSTFSVGGRGGLSAREWAEYDRLREERAARVQARIESGRAQTETAVGYEDRLRLRELRMRRGEIMGALDRGRVSVGEGVVLRQELEEIGRQEEAILTRRR